MKLREGVDYVWEDDKMVFTKEFLLGRGYCCSSACRNCPYKDDPGAAVKRKRFREPL